jgi:hypothetical protein
VLLFAACLVLTVLLFTFLFIPLVRLDPTAVSVLAVRNGLLIATLGFALWSLARGSVGISRCPTDRSHG